MKKVLFGAALLSICSVSSAIIWDEAGDAPELLPGQATGPPTGTLTGIRGTIGSGDADLFAIMIKDFRNFRATTNNGIGSLNDTQLFLFDEAGMGVTHNDDDPAGSTLRSTITGVFVPGNGLYYIGISTYNRDPFNPAGLLIWNNTPYGVERAPDGPGAPGPLASWSGGTATGTYHIDLVGVNAVPEPASLLALGAGLAALAARRRRK